SSNTALTCFLLRPVVSAMVAVIWVLLIGSETALSLRGAGAALGAAFLAAALAGAFLAAGFFAAAAFFFAAIGLSTPVWFIRESWYGSCVNSWRWGCVLPRPYRSSRCHWAVCRVFWACYMRWRERQQAVWPLFYRCFATFSAK